MPAFRVSGATGQAPTTAWFGAAVPDKGLSIGVPGYYNANVAGPYFTSSNQPAGLISNYVPYDTNFGVGGPHQVTMTLGAAVTAPDGTMTANHIVETTVNNFHAMTAITPDRAVVAYRRFAVIAQAAERTRMFIAICSQAGSTGETGCRTVFDLAGGQIGVANTQYGSDTIWVPGATSIKALGGGWYLCIMDALCSINVNGRWLSVLVGTDAGSGTGALNISYVGDVTKGINVWKTSLLPPRAWGLQNIAFFDDFTSTSTIDLNNTLAPGFNWYMNAGNFTIFGGTYAFNPLPPTALTQSGSVLTINCATFPNPSNFHFVISTVGSVGPTGIVGTTWRPSALFETSYGFDSNQAFRSQGMAWWESSVETLIEQPFGNAPAGTIGPTYQEVDFNEIHTAAGGDLGVLSIFGDGTTPLPSANQVNTQQNRSPGVPIWLSNNTYGATAVVGWSDGLLYQALNTSTGAEPDLNVGTHWAVFTPGAGLPTTAQTMIVNYQNQNTYQVLWISDNSMYDSRDIGLYIGFLNGCLAYRTDNQQACYLGYGLSLDAPAPLFGGTVSALFTAGDRQRIPQFFDSVQCNMYVDWVKVTQ